MNLTHIKMIDLTRSKLDTEKSDYEKGVYVFKKDAKGKEIKHEIDLTDKSRLPAHKVQWVRNNPDMIKDWQYGLGYSFVTKADPYLPLGATFGADGHWRFKDAVLMKVPIATYIERRLESIKIAEKQSMSNKVRAFDASCVEGEFDGRLTKRQREEYLSGVVL